MHGQLVAVTFITHTPIPSYLPVLRTQLAEAGVQQARQAHAVAAGHEHLGAATLQVVGIHADWALHLPKDEVR